MAEAFDCPVFDQTFEAGADLSTKQYLGVKLSSDGQIDPAGAGELCIGVLQNKPAAAGRAATVRVLGVTRMVAGGAIDPGAPVACDAAGKAVAASLAVTDTQAGSATDALIGSNVIGIHIGKTAAASSDIVPVLLTHLGALPTTAA